MKTLEKDWLTQGMIDFEYKKYILLAYLQGVKGNFNHKKLYPDLSDVNQHYQNSRFFRDSINALYANFPKRISGLNTDNMSIEYSMPELPNNEYLSEIEAITEYALPRFEYILKEGKEISDEVESNITIAPIGILPIYRNEGYLFLNESGINEIKIYQYNLTIFENNHEKHRAVKTYYLESVRRSISNTIENVKLDIVRKYKHLPNPAAYVVESKYVLPLEETLLPIIKKKVVPYLVA
ncbi:hypothetical protein SAMN04515674_117114 [Pseudarcicella hirudinis]|uniref:Uncharacterized protein n=1 Tax=Pseudarcicella hirudinis TaxID=1079859 RepID=A0A1I5Y9G4_9BACT|nr:hypothetical protein [Pseudarcicella hirudinis]SFQ40839.1 hypothetical protein SAMN04515674_117114 [Pseudarcicella hirudinis]